MATTSTFRDVRVINVEINFFGDHEIEIIAIAHEDEHSRDEFPTGQATFSWRQDSSEKASTILRRIARAFDQSLPVVIDIKASDVWYLDDLRVGS